jgi:putative transposase
MHLVFSTKSRARVINDSVRDSLHRYMAAILADNDCHPVLLNSVEDHIHLLFELGRTVAVSTVVKEAKRTSSIWIKTQSPEFAWFAWQSGYAVFAVEPANVVKVREYIANQREHHHIESFQDEYRRFLTVNGVKYDEQYMWD